jgi:hypothetical protein
VQLLKGSYAFDANSLRIATTTKTVMSKGMTPLGIEVRLAVSGFLTCASGLTVVQQQQALSAAENNLRLSLALQYEEIQFRHDDNSVSSTALTNANSLTGVLITDGPNFPSRENQPEYATQREFSFEATAEYPYLPSANRLLDWTEEVSYSGGDPIRDVKLAINGNHQIQMIYPTTPYRAVQSGKAFGYLAYPLASGPIWPSALMKPGEFSRIAPERKGLNLTNYGVTWRYEFASLVPLIGFPTPWLLGA